MMFSSTRLWVAVAAVATASCAWLVSDCSDSNTGCNTTAGVPRVGIPPATSVAAGRAERICYDSRTDAHFFHDIPDGLYYTYSGNKFSFRPDETDSERQWQVDLSLAGVRRADQRLEPAAEPVVSVAPTDMFVDAGAYAVEYTRTNEGMRQNFFIREQLPGDGPLTVELECRSDLEMWLAGEDDLLFFKENCSEPVAAYRDLHVWDAAGRVLESHMELADNTVRLVVDDTDALYPVTVDPVVSSLWTSLGGQSQERQGWAVAGGRDINYDGYEDVVIGSPYYDHNGNTDVGCVKVYLGTSDGISTTASCTIYGAQAYARFGWSVAIVESANNDSYAEVVVGAPLYDNGGASDAGKVFVFYGNTNGVSTTASWTYEVNQAGAEFGWSVAGAGDIDNSGYEDIIIGAPGYSNGQSGEGRAFVFTGSSSGLNSSPDWTAESNQEGAAFGRCVASAGDVNDDGYSDVIVGAPKYSNGQTEEGRAYVYLGSGNGLGASAAWTAESQQTAAEFGASVAGAGDINNDGYDDVIVGAPRYDHGQTNEGKISLYLGSGSGLASTEAWSAESNQSYAQLGTSVACAGDVDNDGYDDIMTGIPYYDIGVLSDIGRVIIYGGCSSASPTSMGVIDGENAGDMFGYTLAGAGTINNNSMDDIIVGSPAFSSVFSDGGKASILDDPDLIYTKGGVGDALPVAFTGLSLYPNPSRTGGATVEFDITEPTGVQIEVLDYTGGVVYTGDLGVLAAGRRSAVLPPATVSTGVYLVRIAAGAHRSTAIMRVIR